MKRLLTLSLLLFAIWLNADAQRINEIYQSAFMRNPDSLYIKNLKNYLGFRMSVFQKGSAFNISDLKSESDLQYSCADTSPSINFGVGYRWLSLGIGFSLGVFDRHRVGRKFDYSTQMHLRAFTIKLQGNVYSGYYLKNATNVLNEWPKNEKYIRNDIQTSLLRLSTDYYFNYTQYSRKALTSQGQMQLRTAGSALAGLIFNYDIVVGDSSFVPQNVNTQKFGYQGDISKVRNMFIGPEGGYAISVVLPKQWFLNAQMIGGVAYNRHLVQYKERSDKLYEGANFFLQAEGTAGYNGMLWFASISANIFAIQSAMNSNESNINTINTLFQATIAYRFKIENDYSVGELLSTKWQEWRAHRANKKQ